MALSPLAKAVLIWVAASLCLPLVITLTQRAAALWREGGGDPQ